MKHQILPILLQLLINSSQSNQNFQNLNILDNSLSVNESSIEINEKLISASFAKIQQQQQQQQQNQQTKLNVLRRRPSY